ncbi:hypothetical protein Ddye_016362 [Dipteronia dyeriana]|uniref:Reverse transcriptase zinc-binding domain-containing protein n=1 Tax=Dipteronia dyeriana TaxID=168575 RepID=A0AAD9X002_9ROSI|nr:hypothetical protein Ddye_016362 [Dipteronia dyeriana]
MKDKGDSLLAKWIWRFGKEHYSLWKKVICGKYGLGGNGIVWDGVDLKSCSSFVKTVSRLLNDSQRTHKIIKEGFQVIVGSGEGIRFWKDLRWDLVPMMNAFPRVYALASNKNGMIREFGRFEGRILVRNVLNGFGMSHLNCLDCPLCGTESESIDHLFLHCGWSWNLWMSAMGWWDVVSCCNYSVSAWMEGWEGLCPSKSSKRAWNLLFCAVVWTICEVCNKGVFDGKMGNLSLALDSVKFRVGWWFKNFGSGCFKDITILLLDTEGRCIDRQPVKDIRPCSWSSPLNNDLIFNVGGSAGGNPGMVGIGGVLRDVRGTLLCLACLLIAFQDGRVFSAVTYFFSKRIVAPTHLLYADDVLIFCRGTMKNLRGIMHAFRISNSISGVPIVELLGISDYLASPLKSKVSDFIQDSIKASHRGSFMPSGISFGIQAMVVAFSDHVQVLRKTAIHAVVWSM